MKLALTLMAVTFAASSIAQTVIDRPLQKNEIYYYCAPCGCEHDGKYFNAPGICTACNMTFEVSMEGRPEQTQSRRITVGLLLFEGADIMDVTGPWSVFTHAGFDVVTFAKSPEEATIGGDLTIKPDFTMASMPDVNVLVFPGSGLAETNPGDLQIKQFIKNRVDKTEVMFSVCSGAFFFAEAGVLKGLEATTFASMIPMMKENYDGIKVLDNVKYTDNGKIVTSGGLSSGIDAAFHVVSKFRGDGTTQDIANQMEYPRSLKFDYARSQLADNFIIGLRPLMRLLTSKYVSSVGDNNQWEFVFELRNSVSLTEALMILDRELRKSKAWEKIRLDKGSLSGVVVSESLGKANVVIESDKNRGSSFVRVTASRIERYHASIR